MAVDVVPHARSSSAGALARVTPIRPPRRGVRTDAFVGDVFPLGTFGITIPWSGTLWRTVNRAERALSTAAPNGGGLVEIGVCYVPDGVVDHHILILRDVVHGTR